MSYFYLATPYSRYPHGLRAAWQEACRNAAILAEAGVPIFSPIAMTYGMENYLNKDHAFWMGVDRPMMESAKGCIMCRMQSWDVSRGMAQELQIFQEAGKPVIWMDPGVIPDEFLEFSNV